MDSIVPFPVVVHHIPSQTPNLVAYERGTSTLKSALVFVGGLTEGPQTNAVAGVVAQSLESSGYGVWELRMRSSFTGFGYSKLSNDVEDISALVGYLRKLGKEKVVLMGASTDRQAAGLIMSQEEYEKSIGHAQEMIADGMASEAMPTSLIPFIFTSPITAYRWNSLGAKGGDDDYFSSDLDDATVREKFGRVDKPILLLPGENDELVLPCVNKTELLGRWVRACPKGTVSELSSLVPAADHTISQPEVQGWVCDTVKRFIEAL